MNAGFQRPALWVLVLAAGILIFFTLLGRLSALEALIAFAVLGGVAFMVRTKRLAPEANLAARPATSAPAPDARAKALIDALPDPALLIGRDGTILAGNDVAATALGAFRVGANVSYSLRAPEVLDAIRAAAADGRPQSVEYNERVPVERILQAHVSPVASSEAGLLLVTFRDLTQERRIDRMRADFVANASHELRTPLASLSGFIDTLKGPARDDAKAREHFLSVMAEQARRMSRLIDDLLSLSRIELNLHLQPEKIIDLVPVLAQVRETLSPLAKERGVALAVKTEAASAPVRGDRDELIRLFENLLENALKYGASGKRVEVTLKRDAEEAMVAVRDFGPGIAPEHLPRLTERFYRVDVTASREQGGTGLGLAIVKHILARHRGRLEIASELGAGATFTARLPLSTGEGDNLQVISTR
jgi:two-component system phosphate regulon sensor histidine kinase PhoR